MERSAGHTVKQRSAGVLMVSALVLATTLAGPAQATEAVRMRQVDVHAYPIVSFTVALQGGGSLSAAEVHLTENGQTVAPMSVSPLGPTTGSVDVVLVIDTSNSMKGTPLANAYRAARTFVTGLPSWMRVGLVTFATTPTVVSPLSQEHSTLLSALAAVPQTIAGTGLYRAVAAASDLFSSPGEHSIILLTDGRDTEGGNPADAAAAAKRARASVYTVGLEGANTDVATLRTLADGTGGTFVPASGADLTRIYRALGKELAQQYVVQYRSRAVAGAQITIRVEVPAGADSAVAVLPLPHVAAAPPVRGLWPSFLGESVGLAVILGLFFLAVFLLVTTTLAATTRRRRDRDLGRRVGVVSHDLPPRPDGAPRATAWIPQPLAMAADRVAAASGLGAGLEQRLERAGVPVRPGEFVVGVVASAVLGAVLGGGLLRSWLLASVCALCAAAAPVLWLRSKLRRRLGRLHEQLPDILMILASSLRAGHSFMQALDMVAQEIGDPAAGEFARVLTEIRLGRPVPDTLNAMAERVGSEDFEWAVLAVNIQREVGGNLAEILENVADTVRERDQIRRQVKVLSGEGRLSMIVLIVLPFFLGLGLELVNPGYINTLFSDFLGWVMLGAAAVLLVVGVVWMRKLVSIDV
jgi:tight adherence protein B